LFLFAEHSEDAMDGLARVDRVQRRENNVTGFGSGECDLHRFAVANFADENDFGRLAQGRTQTFGKIWEIPAELALIEDATMVRMHVLDRVLQGDDVKLLGAIKVA